MANFINVTVDDTSPCISYSPFRDTFSTPNLSAGWNPYYDQSGFAARSGEIGNGTSLHITSLNGASLALQWRGTAIELWGNATTANYSITLDGVPTPAGPPVGNILASLQDLPDASHTVVLTAQIPDGQNPPNSSMLVFDRAVVMLTPCPSNFKPQTVDDNEIAFLGRWSLETPPSGSSDFHTSQSAGDRAVTTFNGTTFLIMGKTSPQAGQFTVTLDNETTTLSGQSSFIDFNSLLFFSTELDPYVAHTVEVRNLDGGELSLSVGGFKTYNTSPPPISPPPAGATTVMTFPKGSIAAFALAGILSCIVLTGLLFYFLIWRPRVHRRPTTSNGHQFRRQSPKEREIGAVLNIGPGVHSKGSVDFDDNDDNDWDDYEEDDPEIAAWKDPGGSGFSRWRKGAMRGSLGSVNMGIDFRRSGSLLGTKNKGLSSPYQVDRRASEPNSVLSSNASTLRRARVKSKGKARQLTGSWSPSYALDLPLHAQQPISPTHTSLSRMTSGALSSFHAAEPSSPIYTPAAARMADSPAVVDPPTYSASVSASHSNPPSTLIPSGPRSVSLSPDHATYPPVQHRGSSRGFLLHEGEPSPDQESPRVEYPLTNQPLATPMAGAESNQLRPFSLNGSARSLWSVDNPSLTEAASLREVIRSLRPRTVVTPRLVQLPPQQPPNLRHPQDRPESLESEISLDSPTRQLLFQPDNLNLDDPKPSPPPMKVKPPPLVWPSTTEDEELVEIRDGVFLSVRETSPFRVDFDSRTTQIPTNISEELNTASTADFTSKKMSIGSSKVLSVDTLPKVKGKSKAKGKSKKRNLTPEFVQGTSSNRFRLTPMSFLPTPNPYNPLSGSSDRVTSFLDFTHSPEPSLCAHSVNSEPERIFGAANQPMHGPEPKSRWSNTTIATNAASPGAAASVGANEAPSSGESGTGRTGSESRSTGSSTFPIAVKVTIPPSPHHIMEFRSPGQPERRSGLSGITTSDNLLHTHPQLDNIDSPTESIPVSVSDLHFRHSVSERGFDSRPVTASSFTRALQGQPGHPPLPGSSRPFDPSILVSRVLGLPPPAATPTTRAESLSASVPVSSTFIPLGTPRFDPNQGTKKSAAD